ncbi:hypothetical protein [Sediminitomix flava]|uniref:Uncharacterized protein n=1 Tax=Sediminitomix flava TaxID=379075 RepID=A0A315ZI48_SEDFL|nr:hypothetical protein [Sediminitomix flava]PWJ44889.1 hypothetical protein BC781_1011278 [Sediminitomix flava]
MKVKIFLALAVVALFFFVGTLLEKELIELKNEDKSKVNLRFGSMAMKFYKFGGILQVILGLYLMYLPFDMQGESALALAFFPIGCIMCIIGGLFLDHVYIEKNRDVIYDKVQNLLLIRKGTKMEVINLDADHLKVQERKALGKTGLGSLVIETDEHIFRFSSRIFYDETLLSFLRNHPSYQTTEEIKEFFIW